MENCSREELEENLAVLKDKIKNWERDNVEDLKKMTLEVKIMENELSLRF